MCQALWKSEENINKGLILPLLKIGVVWWFNLYEIKDRNMCTIDGK